MNTLKLDTHNTTFLTDNIQAEYTYEFTRDADYLKQYSDLVIQFYKKDLNFDLAASNLTSELTRCDENENIFIVRKGNKVIGGSKLSFVKTGTKQRLPLEEDSFTIGHLLPEDYHAEFHGEIGRLVIDHEYRGKEILQTMVEKLMDYSVLHQCQYLFVLAPRLNAVLYRRLCKQLNTPAVIHKNETLPDKKLYQEMGIELLSCDLRQRLNGINSLQKTA